MLTPLQIIKDYIGLISALNVVLQQAPSYGPIGPPIYMLMFRVMNKQAGFTTFLSSKLNEQFKLMFANWAEFLGSADSRKVLHNELGGWFHSDALENVTKDFGGLTFEQIFRCDPSADFWGFKSWDDYFNREFCVGIREVEFPDRDDFICGACESILYNIQTDVRELDQFWVKGEPYSLTHMLNDDEYVGQFLGGTVYQGFLQVTGYHRWASPVAGIVRKVVDVPGTYFAQSPALLDDPESDPYLRSLAFITSLTARQLIFIEADNPYIGLMCFVAFGMTEISTCESTVVKGQRVNRGDQLGMFHFGGSSHALVFRPETRVEWFDGYNDSKQSDLIKVRAAIGGVIV